MGGFQHSSICNFAEQDPGRKDPLDKHLFRCIRRSVRSCSQTIPEALAKIWRAAGSKVRAFSYMVRKLRSIAFQRCIAWRGVNGVKMGQNNDFLPKNGLKTAFLSITILDHPTSDWAGTHIFKGIANFNMCFEKCGTSASK